KESGDRTSSFGSRNTARRTFDQESENLALNASSKQPIAALSFACLNCLGQWPNSANSILVDGTAPDPINSPAIKSLFHSLLSNQEQAVKVNLDVDSTSTLISVFLRQASSRFSTCQRSSSQSDWLEPPEMAIHTPPRGETEHCTKD
ncbi:hypothetical protein CCUS01_08806, partial [Colletotrichum cuscutae]